MKSSLALVLLSVLLAGCPDPDDNNMMGGPDAAPPADAVPPISYESFAATTWSVSMVDGRYQVSITDGTGVSACALSADHRNDLGTAGHQLIMSVPAAGGLPCPAGSYPMNTSCGINVGTGTAVPASCAFYRKWDAQGALLGVAGAINGEVTFAGSTGSCTVRVNVGFVGGSFAMMATLSDGQGAQPWCN